jgi:hypothetical protein
MQDTHADTFEQDAAWAPRGEGRSSEMHGAAGTGEHQRPLDVARDEVTRRAREARAWLRAQSSALVDAQLERAAREFDGLSEATRAATEKLRESGDERIAAYTQSATDNLSAAGQYLRESSPRDLYEDVEELARRKPGLVIGGLFLGGLALARFLRASRRERWEQLRSEQAERSARDTELRTSVPESGPAARIPAREGSAI